MALDQHSLPAAPVMQQSLPGPLLFPSAPAIQQPPPGQPQMPVHEQRQQALEEYEEVYQREKALRRSHGAVVDTLIPPGVYVFERMTGSRAAPLPINTFAMPGGMTEWPLCSARSRGRPVATRKRKYTPRRKPAVRARNADTNAEASLPSPPSTPTPPRPAPQPVEEEASIPDALNFNEPAVAQEPQAHQEPTGTALPNLAAPGTPPAVSDEAIDPQLLYVTGIAPSTGASFLEGMTEPEFVEIFRSYLDSEALENADN